LIHALVSPVLAVILGRMTEAGMGRRKRDEAKAAHWRGHVAAQDSSGLSVRAYCAEQGLREPAFYAWKRTLRERDAADVAAGPESGRAAFAEVVVVREAPVPSSAPDALVVGFACGARVRLAPGFDAPLFSQVARALLEAERC
jgi:hypothetical protein